MAILALGGARAGAQSFARVAHTSTPISGGTGAFTHFDPSVVASSFIPSSRHVSFRGFGTGQEGIYDFRPEQGLRRIVDRSTPVPGAGGTFASFDTPSGILVQTFRGTGAGRSGVYSASGSDVAVIDDGPAAYGRVGATYGSNSAFLRNGVVVGSWGGSAVQPIDFAPPGFSLSNFGDPDVGQFDVYVRADHAGGTGVFLSSTSFPFRQLVIDGPLGQVDQVSSGVGGVVAAIVRAGAQAGVHYATPRAAGGDGVIRVGDAIPGGTGAFTGFRAISAGGMSHPFEPSLISLAFLGEGAGGHRGIYWLDAAFGPARKLVARGDVLDGRVIDDLDLGRDGAGGQIIAFHATFTDGSAGVYYAVVPEPAAAGAIVFVGAVLARHRPQRRCA